MRRNGSFIVYNNLGDKYKYSMNIFLVNIFLRLYFDTSPIIVT